jgi:hypothetical protein
MLIISEVTEQAQQLLETLQQVTSLILDSFAAL